ncbi:hypothetical protein DICPUDRAFT_92036 [Dictyostelium purpureum]|uniref:Uncharacterized protein n=1 Tax=Dictyostelium purpureum TaxID=5786 RepID=F0ZKX8_DICPU|nr:uncharacterized protein DICPUDRAFT_92036 [Dictyostelium purpureum]EGC35392.1 hypothetical protein DICPUDRAFT_92036 [Dictyostelium purpureum]|eukprot:XP_003288068.1 hypothetical protein DICPUDRAFT_92036 [Dictyostelium purpureum]
MSSIFDFFKSPKNTSLSSSLDSIQPPQLSKSASNSPSLNSSSENAFMRTTSSPSIDIPNASNKDRESSYFRMLQVIEGSSF